MSPTDGVLLARFTSMMQAGGNPFLEVAKEGRRTTAGCLVVCTDCAICSVQTCSKKQDLQSCWHQLSITYNLQKVDTKFESYLMQTISPLECASGGVRALWHKAV